MNWSFLADSCCAQANCFYLDEEVTEQFSSLKKDHSEPYVSGVDEGLELEGANSLNGMRWSRWWKKDRN